MGQCDSWFRSRPLALPYRELGEDNGCARRDQVSRRTRRATRPSNGLSDPRRASEPDSVHRALGPVAIKCFSGGRARARLSSQHGSAPGPRLIHNDDCQRTRRRAPRNSIVAQLGGVALLAERDPRHPVIGDSSGRSARGATGTWEASPEAASTHNGLRRPGRPAVLPSPQIMPPRDARPAGRS